MLYKPKLFYQSQKHNYQQNLNPLLLLSLFTQIYFHPLAGAHRLIQTKFTSVVLLQQGLWNDFRGMERISSASRCDVKQVTGRETEAKELKNKHDYSESYWFRSNKVVETSWETDA